MRGPEEFKLVTYRKKRVSGVRNSRNAHEPLLDDNDNDCDNISCEALLGKLLQAETELRNSSFGDDIFRLLKDLLSTLNVDGISEILCYGLGSFSCHRSSKYQLALLLSLKNRYGSRVHIYDPVFTPKEIQLLERFDFNVIKTNEEGKRVVQDNVTLVYMPHCSLNLINNFLYANWSKTLTKCILLTNSFSAIEEHSKFRNFTLMPIDYILRIRPYVTEVALRNNFTYEEVFHELNIHIFFEQDIVTVPRDFWSEREEPSYRDATNDYFTAKQMEPVYDKNRQNEDET